MRRLFLIIIQIEFVCALSAQPLYCTTLHGGAKGGGTICKLENGRLTAAFNFDTPDGSGAAGDLLQASDGKLYGMTSKGGKYNVGTIFSYNPANHEYKKLKDFDTANGLYPHGNLIQATDGKVYGVTSGGGKDDNGVIFSFDTNTGVYTKLRDFDDDTDGTNPIGSLVQGADGKLYGMTSDGGSDARGVIFSFSLVDNVYKKLVNFNEDIGWDPVGSLVLAKDGKLYGMTRLGGSRVNGVIFSFNPATGAYTKLNEFTDSTGRDPMGSLTQAADGKLYGTTYAGGSNNVGVIFSFDTSTSTYIKLRDLDTLTGGRPYGSLLKAKNGKLYGITNHGLFSFSPFTQKYRLIKGVRGLEAGSYSGSLIQGSDSKFYGMFHGRPFGNPGSIVSLDLNKSVCSRLRDFGINATGYSPHGRLLNDGNGILYGVTRYGGRYGGGVIFSFNARSGVYIKLKDMDNAKGENASDNLVLAKDGKLYGTTGTRTATNSNDIIFCFDPATKAYKNIIYFTYNTGSRPIGNLIQANDGKLYGVTAFGGSKGGGVIFSYDPSLAIYKNIKGFTDSTGASPCCGLVQASDGKLYGMTDAGGKSKVGVIFSFDINTGLYTRLIDFGYMNGSYPFGSMLQGMDGKLYGTTRFGGDYNNGVLFSYDITSHVYKKLKEFTTEDGVPGSYLAQASEGKLYGTWELSPYLIDIPIGEYYEPGGAYSYDPLTSTFTKLQNFDATTGLHPKTTCFTEVRE